MFFLMSSFLLFKKINCYSRKEAIVTLKKYIWRILKLYFFWFIILLPITLYIRNYFRSGFVSGILLIIKNILFGSTFLASWYLMALIIGIVLVYFGSEWFGNSFVLLIGLIFYLICCAMSNYGTITYNWKIIQIIRIIAPNPTVFNSFPVGLLWIIIGKMAANGSKFWYTLTRYKKIGVLFSVLLLLGESLIVKKLGCAIANDCYLMLIPLCTFLFMYILDFRFSIKHAQGLRAGSTVTYCIHASILPIIKKFLLYIDLSISNLFGIVIWFILTVLICAIVTVALICLSHCNRFQWIKCSY